MVRKKPASTTMDARIDELKRKWQESEARNQQRLNETLARMESILAAMQLKESDQLGLGNPRTKEKPIHSDGDRRLRKIDLPVFNGDDVTGWLMKIERFFKVRRIDEGEKLDAALMAMEGEALAWIQWWETNSDVLSWEGLKEALLRRFQPTVVNNAFEMLMNMKQDGTVRKYRKKFETIAKKSCGKPP